MKRYPMVSGKLSVSVVAGRNLAAKSYGGTSDPYCVVRYEQQELKTQALKKTLNPTWNFRCDFDVTRPKGELVFSVWDKDRFLRDSFLGRFTIDLANLISGTENKFDGWIPLRSRGKKKEKVSGEVYIGVVFKAISKKVGKEDFDLLTLIGKGGFGKVLQVKKIDTNRIYAMKIIRKDTVLKKNKVQQTRAEKDILSVIHHPFIVGLKYSFQTREKLYLILDYVNGGELFYHLKRELRFSEERVRFYAAEIISALSHLHKHHIMYRDLKPENILLDEAGHLVLCDFGLVKTGLGFSSKTRTFCGTPEYLAPEMLIGDGYGKEVDWWSLGTLIYEMLTGLPPYYDENVKEMYDKILHAPLVFPPHISADARSLLTGLLTRDPTKRFGYGEGDAETIMYHPFFRNIDFDMIKDRLYPPPTKPTVSGVEDASNFDIEFVREPAVDSVVDEKLSEVNVDAFEGFSFNCEEDLSKRASYRSGTTPLAYRQGLGLGSAAPPPEVPKAKKKSRKKKDKKR